MELCPGEDETKLPSPQAALKHLQIVNADLGASVGVIGVEVRVTMILEDIEIVIP